MRVEPYTLGTPAANKIHRIDLYPIAEVVRRCFRIWTEVFSRP
jgi:hypothetical protein